MIKTFDQLLEQWKTWTDGPKYLVVESNSPFVILQMTKILQEEDRGIIGSNIDLLQYIKTFSYHVGTFFVYADKEVVYEMHQLRPELDIRLICFTA